MCHSSRTKGLRVAGRGNAFSEVPPVDDVWRVWQDVQHTE